jgi:hypothetical protein
VFTHLLELTEIKRVPAKVRKFLHREERHVYAKTLEYFSSGYGSAVDELAKNTAGRIRSFNTEVVNTNHAPGEAKSMEKDYLDPKARLGFSPFRRME